MSKKTNSVTRSTYFYGANSRMQSQLRFIVAISMLFSVLILPQLSLADFSDVPPTDPQYEAIKTLELKNIVKGTPTTNNFEPAKPITRGEFLQWVFNDIGYKPAQKETPSGFKDIPANSPFAPYAKKAYELGIINFWNIKENFNPNKSISRIDALKIAFQIEGISTPYYTDIDPADLFKDVKSSAWFAYLARAAKKNDIIFVKNPDFFSPFKSLTRGDTAELIHKASQSRENEGKSRLTIEIVQPSQTNLSSPDEYTNQFLNNAKFPILMDVWKRAHTAFYYKGKAEDNDLVYGAIDGLVKKLNDKYTTFQVPVKATELNQFLQGEFDGIGASLDSVDNQVVILKPLINSPAEKAGLLSGDVIKKVDDKSTDNLSIENVVALIKGPAGTPVRLTIQRGSQSLEFSVVRAKIVLKSVTGKMVEGNIAYIKIDQFLATTPSEFTKTANALLLNSPRGFILDLRNNPGGYLNTSVDVLGHFVEKGKLAVKTKTTDGVQELYFAAGNAELSKYPLIVLIDNDTASAAEIVAGALQDYKLGKLLGEKSFGKGSVQELVTYTDKSIFKITIAHWLTPLERDINGIKLSPEIEVKRTKEDITAGKDPQLNAAIAELQK